MASVIYRGERFDFDESIGSCGDTSGHNAKCPSCVPERWTDPDRLLEWIATTEDRRHAWHVYSVASSWFDPSRSIVTVPWAMRIREDLASGDPFRMMRHLVPGKWGTWLGVDGRLTARQYLTAEATEAELDG